MTTERDPDTELADAALHVERDHGVLPDRGDEQ